MLNKLLNFNFKKAKKINQYEEEVEPVLTNDTSQSSSLGSCPECDGHIIDSGHRWVCNNWINGYCGFGIDNTDEHGNKMPISVLDEYRQFVKFKSIQAVIESSRVARVEAKGHNTTNTYCESVNVQNNTTSYTQYNTQVETANIQDDKTYSNTETKTEQNTQPTNTEQNSNYSNVENNNNNNSNDFFKNARSLGVKCSCGSEVFRYGYEVKCSNVEGCGFSIKTQVRNKPLKDSMLKVLLNRRISYPTTFVSANNKEYKARYFIDIDDNGNFLSTYKIVFDNELEKLDEKYKKFVYSPDKDGRTNIPLQETIDEVKNRKNNNSNNGNNKSYNNSYKKSNQDDYKNYINNVNNTQNNSTDNKEEIKKINDESEPF